MIAISLAKIRECFQKEVPGQFGTTPPLLHVLLYHRTHDRGEHLSLDAWTGDLHAGPVRHKLKDW